MIDPHLTNLVGAAAVAVRDRIGDILSETAGLEGEGPAALLTVGTRPGRPIKLLSRSLGLSHSGTVRLVDRLESRGWVRRNREEGGRAVRLDLTESGRRMFDELLAARQRALEDMLEPLRPKHRDALRTALGMLLSQLPGDRRDAWHICRLCEHRVCRGATCPVGSVVEGWGDEP